MQSQLYFQNDVNKTLKCNRKLWPLKGELPFLTLKPWISISRITSRLFHRKAESRKNGAHLIKPGQSITNEYLFVSGDRRKWGSGANSENLEELDMKTHTHNWNFIIGTLYCLLSLSNIKVISRLVNLHGKENT